MKKNLAIIIALCAALASCIKDPDSIANYPIFGDVKVYGIAGDAAAVSTELTNAGAARFEQAGYLLSLSEMFVDASECPASVAEDSLKAALSNLAAETAYYVKAFARNGEQVIYGPVASFTTASGSAGPQSHYVLAPIANLSIGASGGDLTVSVKSYKVEGGQNEAVKWKLSISADSTDWSAGVSGISASAASGNGSETGEDLTFTIGAGTSGVAARNISQEHAAILRGRTTAAGYSVGHPYDLCMHNIPGDTRAREAKPITSNCYVVDAPGWYCFPVVYGNAIDYTKESGTVDHVRYNNVKAFNNGAADSDFEGHENILMRPLQDFNSDGITHPYILKDLQDKALAMYNAHTYNLKPIILWQDVEAGKEIISESELRIVDAPSGAGIQDCKYIVFNVPEGRIRPGNVVIALRDENYFDAVTGSYYGIIVWSWNIWITACDLTPIPVERSGQTVCSIMPMDLGWSPVDVSINVEGFSPETWFVKIEQDVEDGVDAADPVVFSVTREGESPISILSLFGSGNYYQLGRKDPFPGTRIEDGKHINKSWCTSATGPSYSIISYMDVTNSTEEPVYGAGMSIRKPHTMLSDVHDYLTSSNTWWLKKDQNEYGTGEHKYSYSAHNLWNHKLNTWNYKETSGAGKTVYDPCPPRFCVPTYPQIFPAFSRSANGQNSQIWSATLGYGQFLAPDLKIFMPFGGQRLKDGSIIGSSLTGKWWLSSNNYPALGSMDNIYMSSTTKELKATSGIWVSENYPVNGLCIRPVEEME